MNQKSKIKNQNHKNYNRIDVTPSSKPIASTKASHLSPHSADQSQTFTVTANIGDININVFDKECKESKDSISKISKISNSATIATIGTGHDKHKTTSTSSRSGQHSTTSSFGQIHFTPPRIHKPGGPGHHSSRSTPHLRLPSSQSLNLNRSSLSSPSFSSFSSLSSSRKLNKGQSRDILSLAIKATIIAVTISGWSLIILAVFILVYDWNIVFLMITIDTCINSICIILYWSVAKSLYKCLCFCPIRCAKKFLIST